MTRALPAEHNDSWKISCWTTVRSSMALATVQLGERAATQSPGDSSAPPAPERTAFALLPVQLKVHGASHSLTLDSHWVLPPGHLLA